MGAGDAGFTNLATPRLVLRRFTAADLEPFVAYRSQPAVARYQDWDTSYSIDQARAFFDALAATHPCCPGGWFQFAVVRASTGVLVGDCALFTSAEDPPQGVIGYTLAPEHHGHGYATEAVRRLLDYLFTDRGFHRVTATADVRNHRSVALLERVGLRREAHFIHNTWFKGAWSSEYAYGVLRAEWPPPDGG